MGFEEAQELFSSLTGLIDGWMLRNTIGAIGWVAGRLYTIISRFARAKTRRFSTL